MGTFPVKFNNRLVSSEFSVCGCHLKVFGILSQHRHGIRIRRRKGKAEQNRRHFPMMHLGGSVCETGPVLISFDNVSGPLGREEWFPAHHIQASRAIGLIYNVPAYMLAIDQRHDRFSSHRSQNLADGPEKVSQKKAAMGLEY